MLEFLPRVTYYSFIKTPFSCFYYGEIISRITDFMMGNSMLNHPSIKIRALASSSPENYFSLTRLVTYLSLVATLNALVCYHQAAISKCMCLMRKGGGEGILSIVFRQIVTWIVSRCKAFSNAQNSLYLLKCLCPHLYSRGNSVQLIGILKHAPWFGSPFLRRETEVQRNHVTQAVSPAKIFLMLPLESKTTHLLPCCL